MLGKYLPKPFCGHLLARVGSVREISYVGKAAKSVGESSGLFSKGSIHEMREFFWHVRAQLEDKRSRVYSSKYKQIHAW